MMMLDAVSICTRSTVNSLVQHVYICVKTLFIAFPLCVTGAQKKKKHTKNPMDPLRIVYFIPIPTAILSVYLE